MLFKSFASPWYALRRYRQGRLNKVEADIRLLAGFLSPFCPVVWTLLSALGAMMTCSERTSSLGAVTTVALISANANGATVILVQNMMGNLGDMNETDTPTTFQVGLLWGISILCWF